MSIRPDFAARLGKFFESYGHHYEAAAQPPQTPAGVQPNIATGAPSEAIAPTQEYQDNGGVPHHSEYQPRATGKFSGPPIAKWYKMQGQE